MSQLHQEKLIKLAEKAINTDIPNLYYHEGRGWAQHFYKAFGTIGQLLLEKIKTALKAGNIDPLIKFTRELQEVINILESEQIKFNNNLIAYRKIYLMANNALYLLCPDKLSKEYQQAISQLKQVRVELREILLRPALEFLRVAHASQAADRENLHPAQQIFSNYGQYDNLCRIMQYAGFFNLNLPKRVAAQEPASSQPSAISNFF